MSGTVRKNWQILDAIFSKLEHFFTDVSMPQNITPCICQSWEKTLKKKEVLVSVPKAGQTEHKLPHDSQLCNCHNVS